MNLLQRVSFALSYDYRIERELGVGAMAAVYLAQDFKHDRKVALKVLRPELALAVGAERFLREIRTAAKLSHPGILPLFDSGEADGLLYYTMPVVDGGSLRQRLQCDGRLAVDEAVRIAGGVARALAYAHEHRVIHRDIKPENILLENGVPRIVDFGIALAVEESDAERLTHTGVVIGTPAYMSPEQGAGSTTIDHRSDIYSLACVLYEMLTGAPPFEAPTVQATIVSQMVDPPPRVRKSRPMVPLGLEATVQKALAKDPAERFQSAAEFADALDDPARRPQWRWLSRRTRRITAAAGVTVVALVTGAIAMRSAFKSRPPLHERDWVLVSDFEGPARDPTLATAVRELVTTELNQSRFMATMPRQQLAGTMRAAGMPDTQLVNIDLARELAYRSAVRAVIGGTIDSTPAGYALNIRALDARDGNVLATAQATVPVDSLIPTVQRLAHSVREQLGERREDLEQNQLLLDIATPSLPAFRRYVEALARKQKADIAGSNRLARDAIALDSGFASAWALMGMNYVEARDLDSARLMLDAAARRPERLTRAQRLRLLADAAYAMDRDLPKAVHYYDEYLRVTTRSIGGHNNRGLYLSMMGRYEDALAEFEQAAENNPFGPDQAQPALINATDMLMALGKLSRAQAKAREMTGVYASFADIRLLVAADRWRDADTLASRLIALPTTPPALRLEALTTHAAALAVRGDVRGADTALAHAARQSAGAPRRWYEQVRSLLALTSGARPLDLGSLAHADDTPGALMARGIRLAIAGDTAGAKHASQMLARLSPAERARLGHGPLVIRALVNAAGRRYALVTRDLADTARFGEHDGGDLDHVPSVMLRWSVADAYAHRGRPDSARIFLRLATELERVPPGHRVLRGFAQPFLEQALGRWRVNRAGP